MAGFFDIAGPVIRMLDAEIAHNLAIKALKSGLVPRPCQVNDPRLKTTMFGLEFPNPIGLAPGFDKNAEAVNPLFDQQFGFVEIGTVTPLPQSGNPKPRLFRLRKDAAIINRMGFNNDGHAAVAARLQKAMPYKGILGVNIGANKTSDDRVEDYVKGIEKFHQLADYLTVNISSPNTPGLRALQSGKELEQLLERINAARFSFQDKTPVLLKIAPDLIDEELLEICEICMQAKIDGLIISNTTLAREGLKSSYANQQGGLSGEPLFQISTRMLARAYKATSGQLPLIGVGGIATAKQAFDKLAAGASLLQLYSAMVYRGPHLARNIANDLANLLDRHNLADISAVTGINNSKWL